MKEIFERRSVRKYTDERVSEEAIEKLLRAAMRAPSAMNLQPWEFVVVRQRETLDTLSRVQPYAKMLQQAACAVVICGNTKRGKGGFWVQDCSAATQNLLLEAVHLGLGAVWLGLYPMEMRAREVQSILNLPEHIMPLNMISIGRPAEQPQPMDSFDTAKVYYERWER